MVFGSYKEDKKGQGAVLARGGGGGGPRLNSLPGLEERKVRLVILPLTLDNIAVFLYDSGSGNMELLPY